MTVGESIRKVRLAKGMTQKQVADACGMADSAIRKYEYGQITPKLANLQRIATALGVPLQELVDDWNAFDKEDVKQVIIYGKDIIDSSSQEEHDAVPQVPTYLNDNMRYCRDFLGLTQKALAEKTGIPVQIIRAYESGNSGRFITEENLQKIADAFGVPAKKLLGHSVTYEWMEKTYFQNAPPKERIAAALDKLNEKGQGIAAERVEELTSILEYQATAPPQDTPAPSEGTDTTPPVDGPQEPPEGK